jgi:hypothetical protein
VKFWGWGAWLGVFPQAQIFILLSGRFAWGFLGLMASLFATNAGIVFGDRSLRLVF